MKEPVFLENAARPVPPYTPGIRCPASAQLVFVSGQIGADPATGALAADTRTQIEQTLRNLESVLKAAGSSMASVVKVMVLLQDMNDFALMNEIYAQFFPEPYPARTAYGVARLPRDARIEIEAIALVEG